MPIINIFSWIAKAIGDVAAVVLKFFGDHPTLMKWTTILLAATGALLVFTGTMVAVGAAATLFIVSQYGMILALQTMLPVIGTVGAAMWAAFAPLIIPALKVAAVIAAVVAVWWLLDKAIHSFLNKHAAVREFVEKMVMFFSILGEALSNWNGDFSTISEESAKSLEKAGLLNEFLLLVKGIWQLIDVTKFLWNEFKGPLIDAMDMVANLFGQQLNIDKTQDGFAGFIEIMMAGFRLGLYLFNQFAMYISFVNILWNVFKSVAMSALTVLMTPFHALILALMDMWTILTSVYDVIQKIGYGDFSGALSSIKGFKFSDLNVSNLGQVMDTAGGALKDDWAGTGRAHDYFMGAYDRAQTPIEGVLNEDPRRATMDVGPISQPMHMDAESLTKLIQSGKMTSESVNKGIAAGEIIINATLEVDGEKMAKKVMRVNQRGQGRSPSMRADPRFDTYE
jgi:hypothetical protein